MKGGISLIIILLFLLSLWWHQQTNSPFEQRIKVLLNATESALHPLLNATEELFYSNSFPQQITILKVLSKDADAMQILQKIKNVYSSCFFQIILIEEEIVPSEMDPNDVPLLTSLLDESTAKRLFQSLRTRHRDECLFTHIPCRQYYFYLHKGLSVDSSYYQVSNWRILHPSHLQYVMESVLGVRYEAKVYSSAVVCAAVRRKVLENGRERLRYLQGIYTKAYYIHTKEENFVIEEYLNNIERVIYGNWTAAMHSIEVDIMHDDRVGQIDLFPTQYKVGVYLPIMILGIYPFFIFG